jgi:glycosyltransferase involved in cell wall biosynthesis
MVCVSVIIPAYNAGKFLGEAIKSVVDQLYQPLEIIVIDDGSTDNTEAVAKSFKQVHYIHQENQGTAVALNNAIKQAKGDVFAFLDADDIWLPCKLEKQIGFLKNHESVDMVFSLMENFLCNSLSEEQKSKIEFDGTPRAGIHKSALVMRKEAFFKVGFFSTASNIDLLDWYARARECNIHEEVIGDVLVKRRIHSTNQTLRKTGIKKEFPTILKTILDRRRSQQ